MRLLNNPISLFSRSLLLMLFISYSGSIMMFYHTHEVQGVRISHSHPFKHPLKNSSGENHSHSTAQYILLHHLCETSLTDSVLKNPVVPDLDHTFSSFILSPYTEPFSLYSKSAELLRAPPVC